MSTLSVKLYDKSGVQKTTISAWTTYNVQNPSNPVYALVTLSLKAELPKGASVNKMLLSFNPSVNVKLYVGSSTTDRNNAKAYTKDTVSTYELTKKDLEQDLPIHFVTNTAPAANVKDYKGGTTYLRELSVTVDYDITSTVCTAPTVTLSATKAKVNEKVTVKWENAKSGSGNTITGYEIQQIVLNGSAWSSWTAVTIVTGSATSGTAETLPNQTEGSSTKYRVRTLCANADFYSTWSESAAVKVVSQEDYEDEQEEVSTLPSYYAVKMWRRIG